MPFLASPALDAYTQLQSNQSSHHERGLELASLCNGEPVRPLLCCGQAFHCMASLLAARS